jgi:endonuclease/exonuclease/phosphatase family metal-dependent hydrolase
MTHGRGRRAGALAAGLLLLALVSTAHAQTTLRVLQMNLCNSGLAGCYAGGRAVTEAYSKITGQRPDVVTLNEICSGDIQQLWLAMQAVWPGQVGDDLRGKTLAFAPAWNGSTGQSYKCANGQEFGNGVLWHAADPTAIKMSGIYSNQDSGSEKRSWQCVQIMPNGPYSCTTHLSAASEPVALAQCRELMSHVAAATGNGTLPAVIGGDFNLEYDTSDPENVQNCVPAGYYRKGDGDVQHFIADTALTFVSRTSLLMVYTDHPAFLLVARMP